MKRVTLYTKTGCTSCLKARQYLLGQGVHYTERDIFKHPLTETELREMAKRRPLRELFSFRSPSAKALGLLDRELSDEEMLSFMLQEPRLIRRPLITTPDQVEVGFKAPQVQALLTD